MKKKGRKVGVNKYADLEGDVDHYDVSESDDDLGEDGRIMLNDARGRRVREEEEEVLNVYHSSDEDSEASGETEKEGLSDLEDFDKKPDEDGLPSSKAWGSKKGSYYNTDYVDKDYLGFDDEEAALMEEQEANEIQKRILAQMEETDFSLGLLDKVEDKKKEKTTTLVKEQEKVEKNLSLLNKNELVDVIKRETPGFFSLLNDCKDKIKKLSDQILPILEMEESGELPECDALKFLRTYNKVINYYMMNTAFFMLLKSKREKTEGHPIVKRLGQLTMYLGEMDACLKSGLGKQINKILEAKREGVPIVEKSFASTPEKEPANRKERRQLAQLKKDREMQETMKIERAKRKLEGLENDPEAPMATRVRFDPSVKFQDQAEDETIDQKPEKRAATYQILKNKGLTPKRKKETRNPRIKYKNKYKKAVIRRKGQVTEARKEIKKYSGEISGIKKNLSKSIKLK